MQRKGRKTRCVPRLLAVGSNGRSTIQNSEWHLLPWHPWHLMVLPDTVTVRAPNPLLLWFTYGVEILAPDGAVRDCNIKLLR